MSALDASTSRQLRPASAAARKTGRACASPELSIGDAVRRASAAGYRRGQLAVALVELACQLVEVADDEDREMAVAAMERRLRMLADEWAPGDADGLATERAAILFPDRQPPRKGIVPRCLW